MKRRRIVGLLAVALLAVIGVGIAGAATITATSPTDGEVLWEVDQDGDGEFVVQLTAHVDQPDLDTGWSVEIQRGPTTLGTEDDFDEPGEITAEWNQTVAAPPQPGENIWTVAIYDETDSLVETEDFAFTIPYLELFDERERGETGVDFEATFSKIGESDSQTRESDGGKVPLHGFEDQGPTTVDITPDSGYYSRSIIIDGFETEMAAWAIPTDASSVGTLFEIDDLTGQFGEQSRIELYRGIGEDDANVQVAGNTFGAGDRATFRLLDNRRYNIRVVSQDGVVREFGDYVADVDNERVELEIGEIGLQPDDVDDYVFRAFTQDATIVDPDLGEVETKEIVMRYVDGSESTEWLNITIHKRGNESIEIYNESHADVNEFQATRVLDNTDPFSVEDPSESWIVNYEIVRSVDERTQSGWVVVGGIGSLNLPLSSTAMQTIAIASILLVAGLFGGALSAIGGIVVVALAWMLYLVNILTIPPEFLLAASVIAIMFHVSRAEVIRT